MNFWPNVTWNVWEKIYFMMESVKKKNQKLKLAIAKNFGNQFVLKRMKLSQMIVSWDAVINNMHMKEFVKIKKQNQKNLKRSLKKILMRIKRSLKKIPMRMRKSLKKIQMRMKRNLKKILMRMRKNLKKSLKKIIMRQNKLVHVL